MKIEVGDNQQFDFDSLERYLQNNSNIIDGFNSNTKIQLIKQCGSGQSNPTYIVETSSTKYILRKKPKGKLLPKAHAIDREYIIMKNLKKVNFPVPKMFIYCDNKTIIGEEFYLMEFVEGRIFLNSTLPNVSNKDRREMYISLIDTLSKLHKINWKDIGLEGFGKPDNYYERQIKTWERQYKSAKTHEIPEMTKLIDWLSQNVPKNDNLNSIVHGDYNIHNVIFHPTENRIIAVIDWELSTIGHPFSDLSYILMWYRMKPINGLQFGLKGTQDIGIPNFDELFNKYKKETKIEKIENFNFYIAFSFLRIGGITQGVYKRGLQGNSSQKNTNIFKTITEYIAKEGWKVAQEFKNEYLMDGMCFVSSKKVLNLKKRISDFLDEHVLPFEYIYEDHVKKYCNGKHVSQWKSVPIMEEWKKKAKKEGLWNLFLSDKNVGAGLLNVEYAILAEEMFKKSFLAPEIFNCSAPDTGNMEILHLFGTNDQKQKWLKPLLNGDIRSCFGMTEPDVASSDATNIECSIQKVDDHYFINGKKWWISGAGDPRCKICILMGKTDFNTDLHKQQSMILVPMDTPGVKVIRALNVFGYNDAPEGHCEISFDNVKVPISNVLLGEGRGFEIAQARLGPGRIHHCMRMIGLTERCITQMCKRANERISFGKKISDHQVIQHYIAQSRMEIEQARLLVLKTADMIDRFGVKNSRSEIAMIKVIVPKTAQGIIDRAIQVHGGGGVSDDFILSRAFIGARTLRLADGPDEVHTNTVAKIEIFNQLSPLDQEFSKCSKYLSQVKSTKEKIKLYGLYQQSTFGDLKKEIPSSLDEREKVKIQSWKSYRGLTKENAKKMFIESIQSLRKSRL
eukprot:gene1636-12761_t